MRTHHGKCTYSDRGGGASSCGRSGRGSGRAGDAAGVSGMMRRVTAGGLEGTGGTNVTILYYHKIADGDEETAVSKETFRVQMQYLADNGYSVWTLGELFLKPAPAP